MQTKIQICLGAVKLALNRDPPQRSEAVAAIDRYLIESRRVKSQVNFETPIHELGLSPRVENFLDDNGIMTVGALEACTEEELLSISRFGRTCIEEVRTVLKKCGRKLRRI